MSTPDDAFDTVVFLDNDGVGNNEATYARNKKRKDNLGILSPPPDWLEPELLARVNAICERTGAVVVSSSSWALTLPPEYSVAGVLASRGLTARVVDACPSSCPNGVKAEECDARMNAINRWLATHPRVKRWVILDDTAWRGLPDDRTVRTDIRVGITDTDVERAVMILQSQANE